jgi:hypothetical protein
MRPIQDQIKLRFEQLAVQANNISIRGRDKGGSGFAEQQPFYTWVSSALNLVQGIFGKDSPHYERLNAEISRIEYNYISEERLNSCRGLFLGAKSDIDGGYLFNLQMSFSGEIFGDFVSSAKAALDEGKHTVAAVLACAALEDALKRYAITKGLDVDEKTMDEVVNALKSQGLVSGTQKSLLATMPKIRNHAMHADWEKLTPQDAGSVIGFVEQFLLSHFD